MSDGDAFEFNNTVHGDGAQINQGKNVTASQTNQIGGGMTFEQFIQAMKESLPPDELQQVQAEVLDPLCDIAAEPEPENEQDRTTLKARIMSVVEKLQPYSPYIRRTIAAFAEGALSTIPPPASWVIAGCIEVVRDARQD